MSVNGDGTAALRLRTRRVAEVSVLIAEGTLDLASYAVLRDELLKHVMDIPRAVVVDVSALEVPTAATLAVFATVWMQVSEWPGVPILIVEPDPAGRRRLRNQGTTRYVSVFPTLAEALQSIDRPPNRRRYITKLPDNGRACATARDHVHRTCQKWGCDEHTDQDACAIANALVANAVRHGRGQPSLRLELRGRHLTIAVYDDGAPFLRPGTPSGAAPIGLGLMLVEALATAWGSTPTPLGGKVVWATLPASTSLDHSTPRP
jgi:anti-anti-sigma regulatory factor/anti-sigma regulatory factor (Ser/Thr protein kinase)